MVPGISEFSYGFALINELVGWLDLSAAPVFPSLIEEGKPGGGYDVKLDRPGTPLYLQFKRSECMERRSAREYTAISTKGGSIHVPFYRFPITDALKSRQHEMLLALDVAPQSVFYVAPRFHRVEEINAAWAASRVASRSVFVAPSAIGSLDQNRHTIAFDNGSTWLCSDPIQIQSLNSRQVLDKLRQRLHEDERPLRERIPEFLRDLHDAEERARERILERRRSEEPQESGTDTTGVISYTEARRRLEAPEPNPPATREPNPVGPELATLRSAADMAAHVFGAQLIVVQSNKIV